MSLINFINKKLRFYGKIYREIILLFLVFLEHKRVSL
mgnify:FL=1|jgi:hypothetical protein